MSTFLEAEESREMLQQAMMISDARESYYERAIFHAIRGVIILVVGLILLWVEHSVVALIKSSTMIGIAVAIPILLISVGGCILVWAAWVGVQAHLIHTVTVGCPYCDEPVQFTSQPSTDFDCPHCHRHVQYEDGFMLPVQVVECTFCSAKHRVAIKAQSYICDRCNQVIKLTSATEEETAQPRADTYYDVILTQAGRNADEVARALESIMICTLKEARSVMERLPAPVAQDLPHIKAESIRDQLRGLGAMAIIIPGNRIPT